MVFVNVKLFLRDLNRIFPIGLIILPRGRRINNCFYFFNCIDGKIPDSCMFADIIFVFRDMNAIDLIVGDEGLRPRIMIGQAGYCIVGSFRDRL